METPENKLLPARAAALVEPAEVRGAQVPRVSIGLPVYNGERFLEETLDAIAAQTFRDYELVISDNASTDRTAAICADRARRDPRIRVSRNGINIGGDRNYNRAFELSRGEFFLGIGADDILLPDYLARTVAALEADPGAVFCHSRSERMDADGRPLEPYAPRRFTHSNSPSLRLREAILDTAEVFVCLGLLRSSALRRTPMLRPSPFSDSYLQAQLALLGRFVEVPEFLFRRRYHGPTLSIYDRMGWCDPQRAGSSVFPHWRRIGEYFAAAARAPASLSERMRCITIAARYAVSPGQGARLLRDLRMAVKKRLLRTRVGQALAARRKGRD